jgi:ABC-type phosphate transport system substrate-binding protein
MRIAAKPLRIAGAALGGALWIASGACSVLLDHNANQCQTDDDCSRFGGHPFCQAGACVESGLGPTGCFYGSPTSTTQFLNQCTTSTCTPFDNCARLGLCGPGTDAGTAAPPVAEGGAPAAASDAGVVDPANLPACRDPSSGRGQVLVMTGSSNFPPLLAKLAPLILATGYTPVFQVTSSCNGVKSVFSAQPGDQVVSDPAPAPNAKYAVYFNPDGTSSACTLGPGGMHVDVGESDIFSTTCSGFGAPTDGVGEYLGPVQAMTFVVPGKSDQSAISAEAARAVFGAGGTNASPWTDPSLYFVRNAATGTQQMIAHAIGVPANAFWGQDRGTASNVDALLRVISDDALARQAIGIISADYYDGDRANLRALAFQASAQDCAYLPDSTPFKLDKRNVRDGHYPIWGPIHFFTSVANGIPTSPAAQAFVSIVSVPSIPKPLLDAFISSSLVPGCAMHVQRSEELGPLAAYAPPFECGCYFEASVDGSPPPGCSACRSASDCTDPARPACNLGFCEAR